MELIILERQRWFPVAGWGAKRLPNDAPQWIRQSDGVEATRYFSSSCLCVVVGPDGMLTPLLLIFFLYLAAWYACSSQTRPRCTSTSRQGVVLPLGKCQHYAHLLMHTLLLVFRVDPPPHTHTPPPISLFLTRTTHHHHTVAGGWRMGVRIRSQQHLPPRHPQAHRLLQAQDMAPDSRGRGGRNQPCCIALCWPRSRWPHCRGRRRPWS
jgi:hypothetical protein